MTNATQNRQDSCSNWLACSQLLLLPSAAPSAEVCVTLSTAEMCVTLSTATLSTAEVCVMLSTAELSVMLSTVGSSSSHVGMAASKLTAPLPMAGSPGWLVALMAIKAGCAAGPGAGGVGAAP